MSNALVVPFHRYHPRLNDEYKHFWFIWRFYAERWLEHFDKLYLIDNGWDFKNRELPTDHTEVVLIHPGGGNTSHWDSLSTMLPDVTEDNIVIMDNDMLIYDRTSIKGVLELLDAQCQVVSILDGSGPPLEGSPPFFGEMSYRAERRRFAPYLFGVQRRFLLKVGFDFAPCDSAHPGLAYDSFGKWTENAMKLCPVIAEILDDRHSLFMEEVSGDYHWDSNLDGPEYGDNRTSERPGYYHIRNWNLGLHLVSTFHGERKAYDTAKAITPFREAARLMAWCWIITNTDNRPQWREKFAAVLADWNIFPYEWSEYIKQFREKHSWLEAYE